MQQIIDQAIQKSISEDPYSENNGNCNEEFFGTTEFYNKDNSAAICKQYEGELETKSRRQYGEKTQFLNRKSSRKMSSWKTTIGGIILKLLEWLNLCQMFIYRPVSQSSKKPKIVTIVKEAKNSKIDAQSIIKEAKNSKVCTQSWKR